MSKYRGWVRWPGHRYDYYEGDGTDDAFAQALQMEWYGQGKENRALGVVNHYAARGHDIVVYIPNEIRTLEEAQAWVIAHWRMSS